jgi:integrase
VESLFFVSNHIKLGPFTIKDLAGHKSLNTTMRYIKIENKEQAEAIDRLEFGVTLQGGRCFAL